jgi:hypothetical protein
VQRPPAGARGGPGDLLRWRGAGRCLRGRCRAWGRQSRPFAASPVWHARVGPPATARAEHEGGVGSATLSNFRLYLVPICRVTRLISQAI